VTPPLLAHTVEGAGPPLLLLNGGLMSLRAWDAVAAGLVASVTVIRCDLRGQLLSPGEPPATLEGHVREVIALLDALALESVHVAGTSFGGLVALALAATSPPRARSLVAITATDRITDEMWRGALVAADACRAAAEGGDGGVVFDLLLPGTFSPGFRQRYAAELAARRQVIAAMPRHWFEQLAALLHSLGDIDLAALLPRIACPTLVLAAGRDETFPLSHSRALAAAIPDARLRVAPEASHGMVLEHPAVVSASIRDFLGEIGAFPLASGAPADTLSRSDCDG
jgi:pimeloyl-ACP methyl ester carboxylesterase